ncbi:hypothetical protein V6N12_066247 [Hibiscus sabdariffa]|uniref:Pentatricopeptide repeat-containing protein n=1 Tax=Hibiscus sabdariffa TaxID=183260 RepID=A0ABR2AR61_9ROSI
MPERDVFAWTTMMSGFLKAGDLGSSRRLFDETPNWSGATWNTMMDGSWPEQAIGGKEEIQVMEGLAVHSHALEAHAMI